MANIEIRFPEQPSEKRTLSKNQPLSIGRNTSNDVLIHDEDVAPMHCRISWNRDSFEVNAANTEGVDLNGTLVRRSALRGGDLLRIGSVDIVFRDNDLSGPVAQVKPGAVRADTEIELKPVPEDAEAAPSSMRRSQDSPWTTKGQEKSSTGARSSVSGGPAAERSSRKEVVSSREKSRDSSQKASTPDSDDAAQGIVLSRYRSDEETASQNVGDKNPKRPIGLKLPERRPVRPGQEDTIRSPFVLGLVAATLVLVLAGAVFYLVIGRDSSQRAYDQAVNELEQGKFTQAIELFDKFVVNYPRHFLYEDALDNLWHAKIEKEVAGGAPSWRRGLSTLQDAIKASRDRPADPDRTASFGAFAEKITLGAAQSATTNPNAAAKPRELLAVAEESRKLVGRYAPEGKIPAETAESMSVAIKKAEAAIIKQETFDAAVEKIEGVLTEKKPMVALDLRLKLLELYPDYETNRRLAQLLAKTLEVERGLIQREELEKAALVEDRPAVGPEPLTMSLHTRSRTDEPASGRTVFALAADCCYGIDAVTGEPVWRRVIGLDTPFFPVSVTTSVPGLLMFDTRFGEMVVVDQRTGKLLWRQPLSESMSGPPLIHEGQIYAPTLGNHLYKLDVESGRITTKLTFSQKTLAPPALVSNGERLVFPGDQALFYTLTMRPLDCQRVDYTAHRAGSITAPLVTMGSLVLVSEGNAEANSRLRVLDVRTDDNWLKEVAKAEIVGQLRDTPAIRGKELFVPSSGERITAFTITDDTGQRPLTQVATLQVQTPFPGPMFLSPGPDGQLWFSGSAVRKLQLKTESIRLDPAEVAAGTSTQPLQNIGQYLYLGRRLPYSAAVLFTQADRDSMAGLWRIVLGSRILAESVTPDGIICVTEGGDIFQVASGEIDKGGFKRTSSSQLKIPADLSEPLKATALADGRIAVYCGGAQPQFWIVNQSGQVEQQVALEQPLEAAPVLLGEGIVLPLPGRLRMLKGGGGKVEDYLSTVEKDKTSKWKFAASIDESDLIAIDDQGRLVRVQYRSSPVPHLAEVAARKLATQVDVEFGQNGKSIILAGADGNLQKLDAATLETQSEVKLEQPATSAVTMIGELLFVETGGNRLHCFDNSGDLKQTWAIELASSGIAGRPVRSNNLLVVSTRDGVVQAIDPKTGDVRSKVDIGEPIVLGPLSANKSLLITTLDGSLRRIESLLKPAP